MVITKPVDYITKTQDSPCHSAISVVESPSDTFVINARWVLLTFCGSVRAVEAKQIRVRELWLCCFRITFHACSTFHPPATFAASLGQVEAASLYTRIQLNERPFPFEFTSKPTPLPLCLSPSTLRQCHRPTSISSPLAIFGLKMDAAVCCPRGVSKTFILATVNVNSTCFLKTCFVVKRRRVRLESKVKLPAMRERGSGSKDES